MGDKRDMPFTPSLPPSPFPLTFLLVLLSLLRKGLTRGGGEAGCNHGVHGPIHVDEMHQALEHVEVGRHGHVAVDLYVQKVIVVLQQQQQQNNNNKYQDNRALEGMETAPWLSAITLRTALTRSSITAMRATSSVSPF
jgi:hypothetical protein